ncbi:MAG: DUF4349 domain-containing protein [Gemmatimonadaceae bacterium]|nr:DUF4349 domain-containing protein [Gemmatimonadaceae bacterium]
MRKHNLSAHAGRATTALVLTFVLGAVAACDRASDTPGTVAVGSTDGLDTPPPPPDHRMIPQMKRVATAPLAAEASAAPAAAADARGVALANPVSLGSTMPDVGGAMLIRNGRASVQVARLDDAVTRLRQTATQVGGFVANTAIVGGKEEHRTATLEIRVPSGQFDAVITALGGLGTVESVSATVQDAGEEYVDLRARAANARHMEARLVEMLARRTGKLSEALTVEQELRRVREEIERYDARLNWLERRTALSSLEIYLHEPMSVLDQRGPSPIAEAFAEAWRRAIGVVAWCIAFLGVLVPLGLLVGGLVLVGRRMPAFRRISTSG